MQAGLSDDIDLSTEKVLKVHQEATEIEGVAAGLNVHEEIRVAGFVGAVLGCRAEDAGIRGSVFGRQRQDRLAFIADDLPYAYR